MDMPSVIRVVIATAFAAAALSRVAAAVLAPDFYAEARRSAPNHIQIKIDDVSGPDGGMGPCKVEGTVVQVFRGDMTKDQKLTFAVSCYDHGRIPDGPTLWTDYSALSEAKYLEAFMLAGPDYKVALDQVEIILQPRDRPYCDSNSLFCESTVDGTARQEDCSASGRVWNWLGLGADECQ